jgi:hypothetical protein
VFLKQIVVRVHELQQARLVPIDRIQPIWGRGYSRRCDLARRRAEAAACKHSGGRLVELPSSQSLLHFCGSRKWAVGFASSKTSLRGKGLFL